MFFSRIIYFPAVLDLLCVTIQITGEQQMTKLQTWTPVFTCSIVLFALGYSYRLDRWASEGDVIFVISVYAQLVALISLLAIRIAAVCYERSVFRPFDFFCASDSRKEIFSCFLKILLGTTLWSFPFRYEFFFFCRTKLLTLAYINIYIYIGAKSEWFDGFIRSVPYLR